MRERAVFLEDLTCMKPKRCVKELLNIHGHRNMFLIKIRPKNDV